MVSSLFSFFSLRITAGTNPNNPFMNYTNNNSLAESTHLYVCLSVSVVVYVCCLCLLPLPPEELCKGKLLQLTAMQQLCVSQH